MVSAKPLTWRQIERECSGIRVGPDGLVATFLRYRGQTVEGVRVNVSSFARYFEIPRRTFTRWVANAAPDIDLAKTYTPSGLPKSQNPELLAELRKRLLRGDALTSHALAA